MSADATCVGTDFYCDCDCECGQRPGVQHTDACNWPECGCRCEPECKGCALAAIAAGTGTEEAT